MKVLLVSPKGHLSGGIARWTGHILSYNSTQKDERVELSYIDTARKEITPKNKLQRVFEGIKHYTAVLKEVKKYLKENSCDVVHFTTSASMGLLRDLILLRLIKRSNAKAIVHFRFGRIPSLVKLKNWEYSLLMKVIDKADVAIVIDRSSYDALISEGKKNIVQLANPISPRVCEIVDSLKSTRHKREILYVGSCYKEKGIFELIDACKSIPGVLLKLAGPIDDDAAEDLDRLKMQYPFIELTGDLPYDQVVQEMLSCTIFCLPSYTEGFPNVVLEAMACGCPIIGTSVGAIPEMLEEEDGQKFGIVVKPKNVGELKDALISLLEDESLRNRCGENVKKRVIERYSLPSIWNKMVGIWESTLTAV